VDHFSKTTLLSEVTVEQRLWLSSFPIHHCRSSTPPLHSFTSTTAQPEFCVLHGKRERGVFIGSTNRIDSKESPRRRPPAKTSRERTRGRHARRGRIKGYRAAQPAAVAWKVTCTSTPCDTDPPPRRRPLLQATRMRSRSCGILGRAAPRRAPRHPPSTGGLRACSWGPRRPRQKRRTWGRRARTRAPLVHTPRLATARSLAPLAPALPLAVRASSCCPRSRADGAAGRSVQALEDAPTARAHRLSLRSLPKYRCSVWPGAWFMLPACAVMRWPSHVGLATARC